MRIPTALQFTILLYLPIRFLRKCNCVCHEWYNIIHDTHFIKSCNHICDLCHSIGVTYHCERCATKDIKVYMCGDCYEYCCEECLYIEYMGNQR